MGKRELSDDEYYEEHKKVKIENIQHFPTYELQRKYLEEKERARRKEKTEDDNFTAELDQYIKLGQFALHRYYKIKIPIENGLFFEAKTETLNQARKIVFRVLFG